jgi:predicted TIM-barrel fold metal-dependent hydrolase
LLCLDAHTHAYPEKDREMVLERVHLLDGHLASDNPYKWQLYQEGTIEALVETETRAGFDRWVLLPITGRPDGCSRINRWAADQARNYPQIIPFASLTPHSPTAEDDLVEALALGLQGIKIHSLLQRIDLVDSQTLGWLGMIQEAGLPVLLDSMHLNGVRAVKPHMAFLLDEWAPYETDPEKIDFLARSFPDITFIAAHGGCLYGWDLLDPLYERDNVFLDLSFVLEILPSEEIERLIQRKGSEYFLFGSDNPWRRPEESWERFLRLDLSGSAREKIAGLNLQRILGP